MKMLHLTLRNLLSAFLLLFFTSNLHAATFTWIGGTGNWHDPANWDLGYIPTTDDGVQIFSGEVTITKDAEANYVFLDGGDLYVAQGGSLYVAPTIPWHLSASHTDGIVIYSGSTLNNSGGIRVYGDPQYINGIPDLIRNYGTINNRASGAIGMMGPGYRGLRTFGGGMVHNDGYISAEDVETAVTVQSNGEFENAGEMDLTGNHYSISVTSGANFINRSSGEMNLGFTLSISGVFHNYGAIDATGSGLTNTVVMMHVGGEFQNQNGGSLNILVDCDIALFVYEDGIFRNRSQMTVNNSSNGAAIYNIGFFVNHQNGVITAKAAQAFYNMQDGETRNYGKMKLDVISGVSVSLYNEHVFSNRPKGKLEVFHQIVNTGGATFNNQGHAFVYKENVTHTTAGNFNNTGALGDIHDNISGINNTSIRVRPLQGTVEEGVPVANALDVGGTGSVTVQSWYTTSGGSTIAGTYNAANNTFTPNANAVGLTSVWVKIRINTGGKTFRHRVKIPGGVQLNGGGSSSRITAGTSTTNGVKGYQIYPNPASEWININWDEATAETKVDVSLMNAAGQQVFAQTCDPSSGTSRLALPAELTTGTYILNIRNDQEILLTQMIQIHR